MLRPETHYPNWFAHYAEALFARHLAPLAGEPDLAFLQVGVFTGDASVWLAENVLTAPGSTLVDVDTWLGSGEPEHDEFVWSDVEATYDYRMRAVPSVTKVKQTSREFFAGELDGFYDFVYIDGDHTPAGVLEDAVAAYRVLKPGGLLAFDDYQWLDPRTGVGPGVAIDAVEACYRGQLRLIQSGLQAWFRKAVA